MGDLRDLYQEDNCQVCEEAFPLKAMTASYAGHTVCSECYDFLEAEFGHISGNLDDRLQAGNFV